MASLRDQLARAQTQQQEAKELSALNELTSGGIVPDGTDPVTARVVGRSPTVWYSTVTIDQGSSDGLRIDDPVVARAGPGGQGHPDHSQHRAGDPDHRRRQRGHGAGYPERRDRGRRARRRQPQRPPTRLPRARRTDRGGADGGDCGVLDRRPRARSSLRASRSGRSRGPPWRNSRPTSASTSSPSPTCATWTSSRS